MNERECAIVSAYTGVLCGEFNTYHKYIEKIVGRPIYTHELADKAVMQDIKNASYNDFINLKPKTYGEETIEDIIAELTDLHKQEQILLNRLDYKLKGEKVI